MPPCNQRTCIGGSLRGNHHTDRLKGMELSAIHLQGPLRTGRLVIFLVGSPLTGTLPGSISGLRYAALIPPHHHAQGHDDDCDCSQCNQRRPR